MNNDFGNNPAPKKSPKAQWMQDDDDEPVVGRIVNLAPARTPVTQSDSFDHRTAAPASSNTTGTESANAQANSPSSTDEPLGRIGRSKLAILATVFVAAGVLGVPLILYSPVFSKIEKAFWSTVAVLYSASLFYILFLVIMWAQSRINL
jgi:hypothetical protein